MPLLTGECRSAPIAMKSAMRPAFDDVDILSAELFFRHYGRDIYYCFKIFALASILFHKILILRAISLDDISTALKWLLLNAYRFTLVAAAFKMVASRLPIS